MPTLSDSIRIAEEDLGPRLTPGFFFERDDFSLSGIDAQNFLAAALTEELYFNIHSRTFPGGEIRGQLAVAADDRDADGNGTLTLFAVLGGDQEVPPADTDATGRGTAVLTITDGTIDVAVEILSQGLPLAQTTLAHIHQGAAGSNGPVVLNLDPYAALGGDRATLEAAGFQIANLTEGTPNDDDITTNGAIDTVLGFGGDDTIFGSGNDDDLRGGDGDDAITGAAGDDIVQGDAGDDDLRGNNGEDLLDGGEGDDILQGGRGDDTLLGGAGDDRLTGSFGDDELTGGDGDDLLFGNEGSDILDGGAGDDAINGGEASDTITTGTGRDRIAYAGDPFDGAVTDPADGVRDIVGNEDLVTDFDVANDSFVFDATDFGVFGDLTFASVDAGVDDIPDGANVIVLQNADNDGDPTTPFLAGTAAAQIAGLVEEEGAGFFVYFNSNLNLNRVVYSTDLSDADADLKILARLTDVTGTDAIDALDDFSADNFQFRNSQPGVVDVPDANGLAVPSALVDDGFDLG